MQPNYQGDPDFIEEESPIERLADRLAEGRLPLDQALGCAADLALALRELHAAGRVHGSVTPVFVALEPSRAVLLPAPGSTATATPAGDVAALGAVLYEMLVGRKPTQGAFASEAIRCPYGPAGTKVYQSALLLSEKCMAGSPDSLPNLRNVATEARLLLLIARRPEPPAAAPRSQQPERASEFQPAQPAGELEDPALTLTDLICPRCGGDDVHISGRRSSLERFLGKFDLSFFRCHRCFHRFTIVFGIKLTMVEPL